MYNTDIPSRAELPSTRQLIRATLIAAGSALILLLTVVLPAEYGVDPIGIGRALGLTEMGETKTRLAKEAAKDAAATQRSAPPSNGLESVVQPSPPPATPGAAATAPAAAEGKPARWRGEMSFTLKPGEGTEVKMRMKQGDQATFSWVVQGGVVNYDTHGDGDGRNISYEKGRAVAADEGELVAAFTGMHGWFWRNRGQADVTVELKTGGTYSEIKRMK